MTPWITKPVPFNIGQGAAAAGADTGTIPNTVDDLYLWYDFSGEYSTITTSSSRVSKITNGQGATNLDMLQGTAGDQPLLVSEDLNGKDVVDFDDSRWLQTDDAKNNVPSVSQPTTYFFVTEVPASTGERWMWDRGSGWGDTTPDYNASRQNCGKSSDTQWFTNGTSFTMADTGQWSYITTIFNGSSGLLRENGTANGANPRDTGSRQISAGTIGIDSTGTGDSQSWNEKIAEIIMYDRALSTSEIEGIELYLSLRWGL
jgi:hypothetical protein